MGHKHITGKAVLITGAGGSIGAVLCAEVLALAPARLSMLSLTEGSLVGLMRTLLVPVGSTTVVTFLLGSVLDETLLARELRGVETVIHCAAHKHVALGELFPAQFVANNVGGTLAVCRHALRAGVTRCVVVSTDKAVQPSSVMGATKWLAELELSSFADFDAYWINRGWAREGPIKTQSRIDTPRDGGNPAAGQVMIAGVAWAQHRGISKVEVRVDEGPWQEAKLAAVPSIDTWRQWTLPWTATPGRHRLTVRATDNGGVTQTEAVASPDPDGATGWHSVHVDVR